MRIAVIGTGYWGINHVRVFEHIDSVEVRWVCDPNDEARERARAVARGARAAFAPDEVLGDPRVDAVVIATPSPTHADLACRALLAGKHVFVEKPLALSLEGAEQVARAAQSANRILMVGHLMLYHPAVAKLRELVQGGDLGDVLYLYSTRVNLGRFRQDENALWSFGPHDISMIDYLLGALPVSVAARGESYLHEGIEDVVFLTMKFADRQMAHVHLSWLDPRKERRLTVVGSKKMAVFDDVSSEKLSIHDKGYSQPPGFTEYGEYLTIRHGDVYIPHIPMAEPLALECRHFVECVTSFTEPRSGIESALRVTRVLDSAHGSMRDDGAPVKVSG